MKIKSVFLSLCMLYSISTVMGQNKESRNVFPVLLDTVSGYAPLSTATLVLMKGGKKKPILQFHDHLDNYVFLSDFGEGDSVQLSFRNFLVVSNTYKGGAPFIVLPNDRIQVGLDSAGWLMLKTDNPARNAELNLFNAMVKSGKADFSLFELSKIMQKKTYSSRDSILGDRVKNVSAFIEEYATNPLLRPAVLKVSRQFLLHNAQFEKFWIVINRGGSEEEMKSYYTHLGKYLQSQDRFSYYFPHFRHVASSSLNRGYLTASPIKRSEAEWITPQEFEASLKLAESFFDSSLVESLQYLLLKNPLNQKLGNNKEHLLNYTSRFPDTDFSKQLKSDLAYRESIDKHFKGNQLLGQKGVSVALEEMISNKRGKVLYIDFWASWCVPCLEEIPHSMKVKEKYKGMPVEFLYLSVDKSKTAWAKGQQRYPQALLTANSFLLLQDFLSPFAQGLRLQAIPRYILIDKAGKIVNANAPRPSQPDLLEKEIAKLLK